MPQLEIPDYGTQIFWLVVTFVILLFLMWSVALPRIGRVLEQRQKHIAGDLEQAEKFKRDAEKAIKALFQKLYLDAWGHTLSILLANLPEENRADSSLIDRAKALDKHYIPTWYPNGFEQGAPVDFYTLREAEQAIVAAEVIFEFCRNQMGEQG